MVEKYKLSEQALACLMLALQKCLSEQTDIVPLLKDFDLVVENGELVVSNPPKTLLAVTE